MNLFEAMRIFSAVVEAGSLSEAGRRLNISTSTISKTLTALEERVKVTLISRTTRQLSVTEIGQSFYRRCSQILEDVESAESALSEWTAAPRGSLRVTAPTVLSLWHISSRLARFAELYPHIRLDIVLSNENFDLIHEGIDVGIRIAAEPDPALTAIMLTETRRAFCASPDYLARKGIPTTPQELQSHNCLIATGQTQNRWPYREHGRTRHVLVQGNFVANNPDVIRNAAIRGLGVAMLPTWLINGDLRSGTLQPVLAGYEPSPNGLYIVTPTRRFLPMKTRCFIEFMQAEFDGLPPWERPDEQPGS
ncbi:LysR family transcriptional regulator [Oceanibacterium hippocampi]|uniref:HTH-type transcriptional regulator DmlR n=1 Tax=Oceanibacterium hippocampi TaxID=745714 RepID=A0A1Y5RBE6_9PROT|nr:LysR family transcriptional regulator [Oceanibacterium hippocampi]SLN13159.1 HTH-type transcriptional regulator DmlR [Oceanibacterium hippocampi]